MKTKTTLTKKQQEALDAMRTYGALYMTDACIRRTYDALVKKGLATVTRVKHGFEYDLVRS